MPYKEEMTLRTCQKLAPRLLRQLCRARQVTQQPPASSANTMKKLLLLAICIVSISAYALPTYEPFTEFATAIAATGTNAINLTTPGAGWTAPGGEQWGALYFSGTAGTHLAGLDIDVTNNASTTIFNYSTLSSILPNGFPGLPSAGNAINIMLVNAQQPFAYPSVNYVGNSAVLHFADDIQRPTSGTKTIYVSYLFNLAQAGQLGTGNNGRYFGFLASTNLNEGFTNNPPGPVTGAAYTNWGALFNTFNGNTAAGVHYPSHGLLNRAGGYYIGACDSAVGSPAAGLNWSSTPLKGTYGTPIFVVGAYVLNSGTSKDTNIVWMNPSTTSFGGATPPSSPVHVWTMGFNMSDLAGLVFIDRVGSGALGGVGTNYIANLIVGSTWSYVTGGPEFTNQPTASTTVSLGGNATITGAGAFPAGATAAGQSVSYQWVKITDGGTTTNNVNPGSGGAGGSAVVSGQNTVTLTLTGISAVDAGRYQLVTTASGTGYSLNSFDALVVLPDPLITANPAPATANYGQTATFTATATTGNAPLNYGWYLNGQPLQNGTLPGGSQTVAVNATGTASGSSPFTITLTLNNVDYLAAGSYYLVVTNNISLQASSTPATLAVNDPIITAQPANPAVIGGDVASFTVAAAGSPTLSYQWYEGTPPGGTPLYDSNTTASGATIGITSGSGTSTLTLGGSGVQDADNGSYYCQITGSGSGQTTNSAAATLIIEDPLTIVSPPMSLTERAGDHVAFAVGVTGGGPQFQWYGPPSGTSLIIGATNSSLVLTNIQPSNNGGYRVAVGNAATAFQNFNATLTVVNSTVLTLSSANLIVARVGDGAQALSGATGNTLYLDQYTTAGGYVNTVQVPDEAVGSPYGAGSAASVFGSPGLLVAGAGSDAAYEAMLTLSTINQEYIGFAGYCQDYPFTGALVNTQPGTSWRGLATINAYGIYSLAYTNSGLYSAGSQLIRGMVTLEGTNFWTTGAAGAGTVKFVNSTATTYANGTGVPTSTGVSAGGARSIMVVNGPLPAAGFSSVNNLVCTDAGQGGNNGLYAASGRADSGATVAFTPLLYTGGGQPGDFAFSPDNNTIRSEEHTS